MEDVCDQVLALDRELGGPRVAVADHPLCRAAVARLEAGRVEEGRAGWGRRGLADYPLGGMPAGHLLADTGTAGVFPQSPGEGLRWSLPTAPGLGGPAPGHD